MCLCIMVFMAILILSSGRCMADDSVLTLDDAISEAIANNTLIREAMAKQQAAMEKEKSAAADLFPKLSAEYDYTHFKDKPYILFDLPPSGLWKFDTWKQDRFSWNLAITQPVFTGFALTTRRKIASLGIKTAGMEKDQAIMDVTRNVKVGYFKILLAKRKLEVAEEAVKQLEAHVADARHFYEQELIPKNDLLKSQVALAHARQNRVAAASSLDVAVSALNTILRRDISEKTELTDVSPKRPACFDLSDLFKQAMTHRPELKELNIALSQAEFGIRMAKSAYYPKIYLFGRYERLGDNIRASNNDFGNNHNTLVGLQAEWQFFEWGKTKADVNKAKYDKKALAEKIEGIRDSIRLEVKSAFRALEVADENIRTAEKALAQAKENFRITNLQYRQQITTSTEVLDARTFLTQAEMNYYGALYGYMIAMADLERAVGVRNLQQQTGKIH